MIMDFHLAAIRDIVIQSSNCTSDGGHFKSGLLDSVQSTYIFAIGDNMAI